MHFMIMMGLMAGPIGKERILDIYCLSFFYLLLKHPRATSLSERSTAVILSTEIATMEASIARKVASESTGSDD